jgi:hypothetical protein
MELFFECRDIHRDGGSIARSACYMQFAAVQVDATFYQQKAQTGTGPVSYVGAAVKGCE